MLIPRIFVCVAFVLSFNEMIASIYLYLLNMQLVYIFTGYTVAFVGFVNGRDRSATSPVSTWWVPYIQYRKPIISLGQRLPGGHSPTCTKHASRSKALAISRPPCPFRTPIWHNFYGGIYSHCVSGRACQGLDETWNF